MKDTLELKIVLTPKDPWSEILVAELSDLGFDSFVNTNDGIMAYAEAPINMEEVLQNSSLSGENDAFTFELEEKIIPHQNWNAQWEENFQPVYIEEYASILAPFHDKEDGVGMIVEIQPQMSFGTGHHQTTWMMTKALFELDTIHPNVLDMGTGTGVLAIVAEKLGANRILAIDIEDWSAVNAAENAVRNSCEKVECVCGDIDKVGDEQFGLIIANINKNILKAHMQQYAQALEPNGTLLLSGFFGSDVDEMSDFAANYGLQQAKRFDKDEWAAIQFVKAN
ncbi:MAG: 50S ribosomal protein L11 methyltransferase [Crocinitomicaceae bacterium]|nr:50S ribosomal protein L11 methyltransferase [Crocinitomicaceae bacterium]